MTKQLEAEPGFCPGNMQRCVKGIGSEQIEHVYKKNGSVVGVLCSI